MENTGVWLPEEKKGELFGLFSRVEESRSKENGGSGLGLYIVKRILELHKFSYEIQNTEKGVLFKICLCADCEKT